MLLWLSKVVLEGAMDERVQSDYIKMMNGLGIMIVS